MTGNNEKDQNQCKINTSSLNLLSFDE